MASEQDIYYINGSFFVFEKRHAIDLRNQRILGQLVGCSATNPNQIITAGLPYLISHYAAYIALKKKLSNFKRLSTRKEISLEKNKSAFELELTKLEEVAKQNHLETRLSELSKRNLEPTPERIGQFDKNKIRLTISDVPKELSSFQAVNLNELEVRDLLRCEDDKLFAYEDLYNKGFYLSSGMKFGGHFLAYPGEPEQYHAKFVVRVVDHNSNQVDFSKLPIHEINALHRLCHTANKIIVIATVFKDDDKNQAINYWSLETRQRLGEDSMSIELKLIIPEVSNSTHYLKNSPNVSGTEIEFGLKRSPSPTFEQEGSNKKFC